MSHTILFGVVNFLSGLFRHLVILSSTGSGECSFSHFMAGNCPRLSLGPSINRPITSNVSECMQ